MLKHTCPNCGQQMQTSMFCQWCPHDEYDNCPCDHCSAKRLDPLPEPKPEPSEVNRDHD